MQRFPDVALEMLRATGPQAAANADRQAVAAAYDSLSPADADRQRWLGLLKAMTSKPAAYQAWFAARVRAKALIEQGRFNMAAELGATEIDDPAAPRASLAAARAETLRLHGIALMLDDKPADAAETFAQARALVGEDLCVAAEMDALACDALKRADKPDASKAAWASAADEAAGLDDPILWERLLELKRPLTAWPASVRARLSRLAAPDPADASPADVTGNGFDDGAVWRQVGQWRLVRGEASAALLAFARAESLCSSDSAKGEARIGQARALVVMGQSAPAMAILSALAQSPGQDVACHALAVLGVVNCEQGRSVEGLAMLERAVNNKHDARWHGYCRAQADLGLAYLSAGKAEPGIAMLHKARGAFDKMHMQADLCQCLLNEAAYLRHAGQGDKAQDLADRARAIEAAS